MVFGCYIMVYGQCWLIFGQIAIDFEHYGIRDKNILIRCYGIVLPYYSSIFYIFWYVSPIWHSFENYSNSIVFWCFGLALGLLLLLSTIKTYFWKAITHFLLIIILWNFNMWRHSSKTLNDNRIDWFFFPHKSIDCYPYNFI